MDSVAGIYHYHRIGHDERPLELRSDGTIHDTTEGAERRWELRREREATPLVIAGEVGDICELQLEPDGCWRGRWLQYERMPVELIPQRLQPLRSLENRGGIEYVPNRFHYVSYAQLVQDCHAWARSLPRVRAIAGVPRSGLIPASLLALELNVPMISVEALCAEERPEIPLPRRGFGNRIHEGIILVVDDTCASGRQVDRLRSLIKIPVAFGAVYVEQRPRIAVDYFHAKLPDFAQVYEWTMFHDDNNRRLLTGVLIFCGMWSHWSVLPLPTGARGRCGSGGRTCYPGTIGDGSAAPAAFGPARLRIRFIRQDRLNALASQHHS